jgi:hypothetical protein
VEGEDVQEEIGTLSCTTFSTVILRCERSEPRRMNDLGLDPGIHVFAASSAE